MTLSEFISKSKKTVFFGGAGVSTESGIPDFRSESGLYAAKEVFGYPPEELLSYYMFKNNPELFFRYCKDSLVALDAKPNAAASFAPMLFCMGEILMMRLSTRQ